VQTKTFCALAIPGDDFTASLEERRLTWGYRNHAGKKSRARARIPDMLTSSTARDHRFHRRIHDIDRDIFGIGPLGPTAALSRIIYPAAI
jgi:hypothetical protein